MKKPLHTFNYNTMSYQNSAGRERGTCRMVLFMLSFLLLGFVPANSQVMQVAQIGIAKKVVTVDRPSSGTLGNFNIIYEIRVQNTGDFTLNNIQVNDAAGSMSNLGSAFVRVTQIPSVVEQPAGQFHLGNGLYNGTSIPTLLAGNFGLNPGQSLVIRFGVEVNSNLANGDLSNQAMAIGIYNNEQITDLSDTGMDPSGSNPFEYGDTGGSDDPTLLPNCWEDCTLACNNLVYVSVNSLCQAEIASEMILEGENELCSVLGFFDVIIRDERGNVIPSNSIDGSYIGRRLQVTIQDIVCGNSCWGNIVIEDKAPPVLNCTRDTFRCNESLSPFNVGFPVDLNSIMVTNDPRKFIAFDIDACGPVDLSYKDSVNSLDCADPEFSSIIYRRWKAIDESGYEAVCYDTLYLIRGTFMDLTLPPHWDGTDNPPLDCAGRDVEWPTFPNGNPDTSYTGKPEGIFCGNIQFDFYDDTIAVCGPSFKILRNWIILDWCDPGNKLFYTQRIKIEDFTPPIVSCPPIDTVNTFAYECRSRARVTPPIVFEECGTWTYTILHKPSDGSGNPDPSGATNRNVVLGSDGFYYINDLPLGRSWIVYYITDECGNTTECVTEIDVLDYVKPVPVCHKHTTISITSGGTAKVPANVLDDGSYDNCSLDRFEARRLINGDCPPEVNDTTLFRPYLEFCCEDIANNPIEVEMRVYDKSGNFSNCKVQVQVQDKIPPFVTCPPHITVSCEFDRTNLSVFGTIRENEDDRLNIVLNDPENKDVSQPFNWGKDGLAGDNCSLEITETVIDELSDCGTGLLKRVFRVSDAGGLNSSCTQNITVKDFYPLTIRDIVWPADINIFGCQNQTDPDSTGKPIINNLDDCNLVAANYEDEVFNFVEGACYKILRKWTVIDWCSYPAGSGYWQHTQVIKIINSDAPVFTNDCDDQTICIQSSSCTERVTLNASAIDDCTPQAELIFSYRIDLGNDGDIDLSGRGSQVSRFFSVGENRITWYVEDQCGNVSECSYLLNINDCKAPTPYCRTGIVTVLMPSTGTVTIWASDLDVNSEDNCTAKEDLQFSFTSDSTDKSRTYTCDDLENGIADTITVQIWVTDLYGNQDFCTTSVVIQDNQDVCPDLGTTTMAMIAGSIQMHDNREVSEVQVNIKDDHMASPEQVMTAEDGKYAFNDLPIHENYYLNPRKNDDPMNGVSTKDLVLIQRHILGIEAFGTPYTLIAADVNNSGGISAKDLVELRKMILGISKEFPNNESWRFVNADYSFPDPQNPWNYEQERSYMAISKNEMEADFTAIKIGDVNGSVQANLKSGLESRSKEKITLVAKMVDNRLGLYLKKDESLSGIQFTLNFDPNSFAFKGFESGQIEVDPGMYSVLQAYEGMVTFSWFESHDVNLSTESPLFYITGLQQNATDLVHMSISSAITTAEAYSLQSEDYGLDLSFERFNTGAITFELFQNVPNPFNGETLIRFTMPEPGEVTFSFFDVSGKLLLQRELDANAGFNELSIPSDLLNTQGIVYYRLHSPMHTATKRMIIIK